MKKYKKVEKSYKKNNQGYRHSLKKKKSLEKVKLHEKSF